LACKGSGADGNSCPPRRRITAHRRNGEHRQSRERAEQPQIISDPGAATLRLEADHMLRLLSSTFHTSDKNSLADALLIEIYASQIAEAASSDVYAFITSNYRDFLAPNGDRRHPHPDLARLFEGIRSRYAYKVEGLHEVLLEQFGDEYLEEQAEAEFLTGEEEPRTLAEIIEAEQEFFDKVWYVRSISHDDETRELPADIRTG